jgi:hypothetical protein
MARSPNRAVIEGNPRLIASSFLLVLHQSLVRVGPRQLAGVSSMTIDQA